MIFDAHSDIWTDVAVKTFKSENNIIKKYHYDNMIKGKIGGSIFVIWTEPKNYDRALERVGEIQNSINKELEYINDIILIAKNYDYIGAPWLKPDLSFFQNCGNGGFSLRKISSFLSILSMPLDNKMFSLNGLYHYYQHRGLLHKVKLISEILLKKRNTMDYYVNVNPTNEDVFFSMLRWSINFKFKIPKPEEAALFSFETNPSLLYEKVGRKLPFGCHAWQKWEYDRFWSRYIK